MEEAIRKAAVLIEALPYIRDFHDAVVVVKYGGSAIEDEDLHNVLLSVAFMSQVGMRPVLVHGGGKFITRALEEKGIETEFIHGQRVTDETALPVVVDVLLNQVNRKLVDTILDFGSKAVSLTTGESRPLRAERLVIGEADGPDQHGRDLGYVGRVTGVDTAAILAATEGRTVPVIAPLATGPAGEVLNCNADSAAAVVAGELDAEKFVLLTDVPGILVPGPDGTDELLSTATEPEIETLIRRGHISGGMMPKVRACIDALDAGVRKAHIIDGRVPHALLLEIFTEEGIGTQILGKQ
ncbi:MAG: acetylglutamate kinase [Planctomycetota bacterium]